MNPKVDWYFEKEQRWQAEYMKLREIILDLGLDEVLKWGVACYQYHGKNVVLIHGFKDYCALLFHKGALLRDDHGILIQQTKNVQSARQVRFTSLKEITKLAPVLKSYIQQAIEVEKAGVKVPLKKTAEFEMAEEFERVLKSDREVKKAFQALTPGRQRGYLLHFSSAKLAKTREARIEKAVPRILAGKGIDD